MLPAIAEKTLYVSILGKKSQMPKLWLLLHRNHAFPIAKFLYWACCQLMKIRSLKDCYWNSDYDLDLGVKLYEWYLLDIENFEFVFG